VSIELKPCPCGVVPHKLFIQSMDSMDKYANVSAIGCCDDWEMEFKNNGSMGADCYSKAVEAWNKAPRGQQ
jgi:hypothetical protein